VRKSEDTPKPPRATSRKTSRKPASLPLDDPRWLPIGEAHRLLTLRLGNGSLAALDLTDTLAGGRVRCLCRSLRDGERSPAPASFWAGYELRSWSDGLHVISRRERLRVRSDGAFVVTSRTAGGIIIPLRGWAFFVWRPDFETRWPAAKPEGKRVARPPPGPRSMKDWHTIVDNEVARLRRQRETLPPASHFARLCADVLEYEPDLRAVQRRLKRLRGAAE